MQHLREAVAYIQAQSNNFLPTTGIELSPLYPAYAQYQQLLQLRGVQARLPYELVIE